VSFIDQWRLADKLSEVDCRELFQVKDARKLQYFLSAPIKKAYVVLPDDMVSDYDTLRQWVIKSMCYVIAVSNTKHGSSLLSGDLVTEDLHIRAVTMTNRLL